MAMTLAQRRVPSADMGIAEKVSRWIEDKGWDVVTASARWGVPSSTLYRLLDVDRPPRTTNLRKIAAGMGVSVDYLTDDSVLMPPPEPSEDERAARVLFDRMIKKHGAAAVLDMLSRQPEAEPRSRVVAVQALPFDPPRQDKRPDPGDAPAGHAGEPAALPSPDAGPDDLHLDQRTRRNPRQGPGPKRKR
jgi:hypothetical protein